MPNLLQHLHPLAATLAWLVPDCSVAANPLQCRLQTWLWALEAAAGILGFLLILAAIFAFVVVRRNRARRVETGTGKANRP